MEQPGSETPWRYVFLAQGQTISSNDAASLRSVVSGGGLLVYPTDTLYALGTDPLNPQGVKKIFGAKNRPDCMPLPVVFPDMPTLLRWTDANSMERDYLKQILPGPLSVILPISDGYRSRIYGCPATLSCRLVDDPVCCQVLAITGPLVATSANRHLRPTPFNAQDAAGDLCHPPDMVVDGGPRRGEPSTIIEIAGERVKIIREGTIPAADLPPFP